MSPSKSFGKRLFNENGKETMDDAGVTAFYNRCPPYRAFVLAMFITFYDNSIESIDTKNRGLGYSKRARAGLNDLFQSLYLPYCDVFLSNDEGCWSALQLEQSAKVISYSDLIAPFLRPFGQPSS